MKVSQPNRIYLLRGNHETKMMADHMTFADELFYKYKSDELYQESLELFNSFPIAAVVTGCKVGNFFCVHGGISPQIETIDDINKINRFCEPPTYGPLWYNFFILFYLFFFFLLSSFFFSSSFSFPFSFLLLLSFFLLLLLILIPLCPIFLFY